jgi:hypothetical protein
VVSNHANPKYPEGGGQSTWRRAEHMACPVRPSAWPRSDRQTAARAASTTWPVLIVVHPSHAHPGQSKQPNQPVSCRWTQPTRARTMGPNNTPEPPRGVAGHRCACEQCTGASVQKLSAHRRFVFHVLTWTPRLAPFACSTAAILWEDGPEGSRTHSQRAGAGPPDAAQVVPQLRGVTNGSPFFQGPQFCTL